MHIVICLATRLLRENRGAHLTIVANLVILFPFFLWLNCHILLAILEWYLKNQNKIHMKLCRCFQGFFFSCEMVTIS